MGLSRALSRFNPELRPALRKNGFLTRIRDEGTQKFGQKARASASSSRSVNFWGGAGPPCELRQVGGKPIYRDHGRKTGKRLFVATRAATAKRYPIRRNLAVEITMKECWRPEFTSVTRRGAGTRK